MEAIGVLLIFVLLFLVINLKNKIDVMDKKLSKLSDLFAQKGAPAPTSTQREPMVHKEPLATPIKPVPERVSIPEPPIPKKPEAIPQVMAASKKPAIVIEPVVKAPPKPSFMERNPDLEKFIGENLLSKIGIVIFVIGMGFLIKMGIDSNVITEGLRVAIGVLIGGGMIALAHYLRKSFVTFSSVLIGGALAVLYFTIALAFHEYHLIPQTAAFIIMVCITAFAVLLAISYDRMALAVLAIIGGFGTPFFVSTGSGDIVTLFSYILILDIGMLALVYYKKWNAINYLVYAFTYVLFTGVYINKYVNDTVVTEGELLVFLTAFYLIFFLMSIIYNVVNKRKFKFEEVAMLLTNSAIYFGFGLALVHQVENGLYDGLFTGLIAVFNFAFTFVLFKRKDIDKNLLYLLIGLVLTFLTLIAPVQFDGNFITLFWALESVLLLWLALKSGIKIMKFVSVVITLLMVVSLLIDWQQIYLGYNSTMMLNAFLNKAFIASLVSMGALFGLGQLNKQEEVFDLKIFQIVWKPIFVKVLFVIVLFGGFYLEFDYQFIRFEYENTLRLILLGIFNFAFVIILGIVPYFKSSDFLRKMTAGLSALTIIAYMTGYLNQIAIARDNYLTSSGSVVTGFFSHYILLALFLVIVWGIYRAIHSAYGFKSQIGSISLWALAFIAVYISSVEVGHLTVMYTYGQTGFIGYASAVRNVYPIVWAITALVLMILGMKFKLKTLRLASLGLFLITIIKLFFYDLAGNSTGKIISFILLGVILLLISFLYQKLKVIILDDEKVD